MFDKYTYYNPVKIIFRDNGIEEISKLSKDKKILIITSKTFKKQGLIEKIKKKIDNVVYVIDDVKSHPEYQKIEKEYYEILKFDIELIIAIGGGSVIDTAKALSTQNKKRSFSIIKNNLNGIYEEGFHIPVIAIPTTTGTSSELTPWATIWDMEKKKKYSLHLPELFCDYAIYDPLLTYSLPKDITIQSGLDCLSHSFESIWNKNANPITLNYAVKSAKIIIEYLPLLVKELDNSKYRSMMMRGTMFAGLAFSNTQTAVSHAISYYFTINKNVPHGIACSFLLPQIIDSIMGKYDFIDDAFIDIFGELNSDKLRKMLLSLQVKTKITDYGVSEEELNNIKEQINSNPRSANSLISVNDIKFEY